jgi:DNA-binding beta-propeller fold protein YncE
MRSATIDSLRELLQAGQNRRDVLQGVLAALVSSQLGPALSSAQTKKPNKDKNKTKDRQSLAANQNKAKDQEQDQAQPAAQDDEGAATGKKGKKARRDRNLQTAADCWANQTFCGTYCVDLQSEASDCGACGNRCQGQLSCIAGTCQCQQTVCALTVVETPYVPVAIASTPDDELVATVTDNLVVTFSATGRPPREISALGIAPPELNNPKGVAVDSAGVIYVADADNQRIHKIAPNGDAETWDVGDVPRGIAVSPSGVVYATVGGQLLRFLPDGEVDYAWGPGGNAASEFARPAGVAVGRDGAIYVVDEIGNAVYRFTDNGADAIQEEWVAGAPGVDPGQFNAPWSIAECDGRVYVADVSNERVQALDATDGAFHFQWRAHDLTGSLWHPQAIAVTSDDRIHVTSFKDLFTFELGDV